jgi:ecotin
MKYIPIKWLAAALASLSMSVFGAQHPELKAFPPPGEGMTRFVIVLPHKDRGEEDAFGVEIIVGRDMLTDGVNQVRLGNVIEPRPLKGWGYTYYEVTGPYTTLSTMMAPPPGAPKVKQFVKAPPLRIAYNSRLPVVVYAPTGYEVRYRIWAAPAIFESADKG